MHQQSFQVPRFGTQPSMDRPHLNEILDALQEGVDFCEDGETTIARDGAIAIAGFFYITDDGQEAIEENEVPQILLHSSTSFPTPWVPGHPRGSQVAQKSRGFFGPTRSASGRGSGTAREALEHPTAENCARDVQDVANLDTGLASVPKGIEGQRNDERYDRRAVRPGENSRGFITVAQPTERRPLFLGANLDLRHS